MRAPLYRQMIFAHLVNQILFFAGTSTLYSVNACSLCMTMNVEVLIEIFTKPKRSANQNASEKAKIHGNILLRVSMNETKIVIKSVNKFVKEYAVNSKFRRVHDEFCFFFI